MFCWHQVTITLQSLNLSLDLLNFPLFHPNLLCILVADIPQKTWQPQIVSVCSAGGQPGTRTFAATVPRMVVRS